MGQDINRVTNPVQWLLAQMPGGDVGVVVVSVVVVVWVALAISHGQAWAGPAVIVAVVATLGLLNAVGYASAPASIVLLALALLTGVAMLRAARAR